MEVPMANQLKMAIIDAILTLHQGKMAILVHVVNVQPT
jgi:hypothetical protein